jgi:hypothetical protein
VESLTVFTVTFCVSYFSLFVQNFRFVLGRITLYCPVLGLQSFFFFLPIFFFLSRDEALSTRKQHAAMESGAEANRRDQRRRWRAG